MRDLGPPTGSARETTAGVRRAPFSEEIRPAERALEKSKQAPAFYDRGAALPARTLYGDRAGLAAAALYQRLGQQADAHRAYQGMIQRSPNSPEGKAAGRRWKV